MLQVLADDVVHGAAGEGQQGQLPRGQADEHLGMINSSSVILLVGPKGCVKPAFGARFTQLSTTKVLFVPPAKLVHKYKVVG